MLVDVLRPLLSARLAVIAADAPLRDAAAALSVPRIGLLVACARGGKVAGVVSKSDVVRHLAGMEHFEGVVSDLMSKDVIVCTPDDDLHVTWQRMTARGLQSMPVLSAGREPVGVLDVRDALKTLFEQEEYQEHLLSNYIAGIGYQ